MIHEAKWCVFVLIGISSLMPAAQPIAAQEATAIVGSGSTSVHAAFKKPAVNATIRTVRIERPNILFPLGVVWDAKSVSLIQSMNISVDGQSVAVPRSVFTDLLDPSNASIRLEKGAFVLDLAGGDASNAYLIRVYFDATKVTRRTVYSALIPNKSAEDTHYYMHVLKDE
jgi:hypothetical protein